LSARCEALQRVASLAWWRAEQASREAVRTGAGVDSEDVSRALTEYRAARDQQLQAEQALLDHIEKGPGRQPATT
jgi:hypothetical protein